MHDLDRGAWAVLRRLAFALALVGLVLSTIAYVGTLFGVATRAAGALHLGAMALALPVILRAILRAPWWPPRARWRATLRDAPPWGERALQVAFLHFAAQFGALLVVSRGVDPSDPTLRVPVARMFSAGWMLAYLLCALAFWPVAVTRRVENPRAPP